MARSVLFAKEKIECEKFTKLRSIAGYQARGRENYLYFAHCAVAEAVAVGVGDVAVGGGSAKSGAAVEDGAEFGVGARPAVGMPH